MTAAAPLGRVTSIKVKLATLVGVSLVVALVFFVAGDNAGIPWWLTVPATVAAALGASWWLARGMTAPLREMTAATVRMASGDYGQRVGVGSADEVGLLARSFNTMAADLATADDQRRQLVATVSHELRTPLAAQRAVLENLVDGVTPADPAVLAAALGQAERLSRLVEDLLDLSRLDAGTATLDLTDLSVRDLLEACVREAALTPRPVTYRVEVTPADLVVRADAARLAQVVTNLLDNAARHSPAGGVVRLTAGAGGTPAPDADPPALQRTWTLEVADEGHGIPEQDRERVFERYGGQADGTGGTGLGLSIVRWAARLHGGTVTALDPPPGRTGARIRLTLPVRPTPPTDHRPAEAAMTSVPSTGPTPHPARPATPRPAAPSAGAAGSRTVLDDLFGTLWPEPALGPQLGLLLGAVAVGAFAALTLPYRSIGLAVLVVLLASGALVLAASRHRRAPWTLASAVVCVGLASLTVLRADPPWAVLGVALAGALVATALTDARSVVQIVAGGAAWVGAGLRGLPLLGRTISATSRHRTLWPVVRTVGLTLLLLVVFGALFSAADAVFGHWAQALVPAIAWDTVLFRGFVWFVVGGVVLAGSYLARNPPRVDRLALPPGRPVAARWEWLVPLGVLLALFVGFLAAQASAMWGGHDYLRRTTGLTYAEYVHQGFGQLVVVTALTLVVIAVTVRKAPREEVADRRLLRGVLGLLCLLTLVVVASALYRMHVYQVAYGFTTLRLFVDVFEAWLGLLVVLVLVSGIRLSGWWVPRAALLSAAVLALGLGLLNPAGFVADHNIDRWQSTGKLDPAYLASLGDDAAPTVAGSALPADLRSCLLVQLAHSHQADDLLSWNLGRSRAAQVLPYPGEVDPACISLLAERR